MDIIARVHELLQKWEAFCLATVVASEKSDVPVAHKAIVLSDGSMEGILGSEQFDVKLCACAMDALKDKKSRVVEVESGVRVFLNVLSAENQLLICGAGHIAVPLAQIARDAGFRVTVLDDRSDFAHPSRFSGCKVIAEDFTLALREMPLGPKIYVVVITRGHEHDFDCLMEILRKETAYVGLIGSRRRVSFVLDMLEREGLTKERLNEVFTPIGIPIGAESPVEIAISIISELVCVRRKGPAQARALRAAIGINP